MVWLVLGVLGFGGVHLFPALAGPTRERLVGRLGAPYRGLFALAILLSVGLMVLGWRGTAPGFLYTPPAWSRVVTNLLMFVALLLFVASGVPTNLKRVLRHPQLTGVATWAVAHLLSNGDSRSLVLFGGLLFWAVAEMVALNRRDGAWRKPAPLPLSAELRPAIGALVAFAVIFFAHPWIAGVSPAP